MKPVITSVIAMLLCLWALQSCSEYVMRELRPAIAVGAHGY